MTIVNKIKCIVTRPDGSYPYNIRGVKGKRSQDEPVPKRLKTKIRAKDRRDKLKPYCEHCGIDKITSREDGNPLTIHHVPPLSVTLKTEFYITLCRRCHDKEEGKIHRGRYDPQHEQRKEFLKTDQIIQKRLNKLLGVTDEWELNSMKSKNNSSIGTGSVPSKGT